MLKRKNIKKEYKIKKDYKNTLLDILSELKICYGLLFLAKDSRFVEQLDSYVELERNATLDDVMVVLDGLGGLEKIYSKEAVFSLGLGYPPFQLKSGYGCACNARCKNGCKSLEAFVPTDSLYFVNNFAYIEVKRKKGLLGLLGLSKGCIFVRIKKKSS